MLSLKGENLSGMRGDRLVFKNLSFVLKAGEIIKLIGSNGCGKSTLLRLLAGFISPAEGRLLWQGRAKDMLISRLLVTPQQALKPYLTVEEQLKFWASLQPRALENQEGVLKRFGLYDLRCCAVRLLSSGQRQRLSLARLELTSLDLWLLDEPFLALDAYSSAHLIAAMQKRQQHGGMIVFADHAPAFSLPHHILNVEEYALPHAETRTAVGELAA